MKLIKNMFLSYSKSNHYKTDIIKIYQDSKFVFASDEVGDLHAVSVFEAMACGCICIVKNSVTLNRLGLKNGYHFIEYDGSEMGLINALKTSLTLNEYNKIRENAYFASRSLFTYDNFLSDLISIP